jgi:hypothetical protein
MFMPTRRKFHYVLALLVFLISLLVYFIADAEPTAPRLIVIGDSLSTTDQGWPNQLREMAPRWNVQVMAQNGRSIRDFSIPRDLWTLGNNNETVVYFLGGNDILQRNGSTHAKYRLQSHIAFLLERNFKVLLIVPPSFGLDDQMYGEANRAHREVVESCRGTAPNLWVYDIDLVWDPSMTTDGIHPSAELSTEIAYVIDIVLSMNIY